MEVVIDIPKALYNRILDKCYTDADLNYICGAVTYGTPIPKGHGRLIDADKLKQKIAMGDDDIMKEDWYKLYNNVMSDIDSAHAIIEAESEK